MPCRYTHVWHPSDHAPPSVLIATYFYLRVASARASVMPLTACAHGQVAFEQICEKHEELAEILTERARERALTSQASFRFPKASPRASKPETKLQQARASSLCVACAVLSCPNPTHHQRQSYQEQNHLNHHNIRNNPTRPEAVAVAVSSPNSSLASNFPSYSPTRRC